MVNTKISSFPTLLHKEVIFIYHLFLPNCSTSCRFVTSDIPTDLLIQIEENTFHVHKVTKNKPGSYICVALTNQKHLRSPKWNESDIVQNIFYTTNPQFFHFEL